MAAAWQVIKLTTVVQHLQYKIALFAIYEFADEAAVPIHKYQLHNIQRFPDKLKLICPST